MRIKEALKHVIAVLIIAYSGGLIPVYATEGAGRFAEVVFRHGRIHTMCAEQPEAEGMAIKDGFIMQVGTDQSLAPLIGPQTKIIDLAGKRVLPGFIESHAHLLSLGKAEQRLDLTGTRSLDEIVELVRERAAVMKPGEWILGRGWDQNDWEKRVFPTYAEISGAAPENPVFLTRIDGHAGWANLCAMSFAGLTRDTKDPEGGRIIRDGQGNPTGVLIDMAELLISDKIPPMPSSLVKEAIVAGLRKSLSFGVTTFHDAGADAQVIALYKELLKENRLKPRLYVMLSQDADLLDAYYQSGPEIGLGHHFLTVRAIKLYADGALGSRGAALLEPYDDDPGNRGLIIDDEAKIAAITSRALETGFQVCTHAIGDRANRITLSAYESALKAHGDVRDARLRIEHAQILDSEDIPRFKELGVIPSMQPTHCTSDMPWAEERIHARRAEEGAYVWRKLLDTGVVIPFGSDAPIESINPLWGIYAAVTRQDHDGHPKEAWHPRQRLTVEEAVRAFTVHGAYAAFEEEIKGSLEEGKLADFVVLSNDIMAISPSEILKTGVVMTVIHGAVVYEKQ
ncbi:MAG: amidohydrolase [Planctomycetota bacterium]